MAPTPIINRVDYLKWKELILSGVAYVWPGCVPEDDRKAFTKAIRSLESQQDGDFYPNQRTQRVIDYRLDLVSVNSLCKTATFFEESFLVNFQCMEEELQKLTATVNRVKRKDDSQLTTVAACRVPYTTAYVNMDGSVKTKSYIAGVPSQNQKEIAEVVEKVLRHFIPALEVLQGSNKPCLELYLTDEFCVRILRGATLPFALSIVTHHISSSHPQQSSSTPRNISQNQARNKRNKGRRSQNFTGSEAITWVFDASNVEDFELLDLHPNKPTRTIQLGSAMVYHCNHTQLLDSPRFMLKDPSKPGTARVATFYIGNSTVTTDTAIPFRQFWFTPQCGDKAAVLLENKFGRDVANYVSQFLIPQLLSQDDCRFIRKVIYGENVF